MYLVSHPWSQDQTECNPLLHRHDSGEVYKILDDAQMRGCRERFKEAWYTLKRQDTADVVSDGERIDE